MEHQPCSAVAWSTFAQPIQRVSSALVVSFAHHGNHSASVIACFSFNFATFFSGSKRGYHQDFQPCQLHHISRQPTLRGPVHNGRDRHQCCYRYRSSGNAQQTLIQMRPSVLAKTYEIHFSGEHHAAKAATGAD